MEAETSEPNVYNRSLLLAFAANVFQLIAVSLLFRYSDFVYFVGGTEFNLGLIVGIATIGGVLVRFVQGVAIDRLGPKLIWTTSLLLQIVALLWHLRIDSATSLEVFLARGLFATGLAGNFGAWLSFVSLQSPHHRVAEVIGVIGASGFVGMAIGPVIGDQLFSDGSIDQREISSMFQVAAGMVVVALILASAACLSAGSLRIDEPDSSSQRPRRVGDLIQLIKKRRPGVILVVGMLMGLIIGFPGTYLRPFAESLGLEQIKTFFLVYNIIAFVSRLSFRRAPQVLGLKKTIALGLLFFLMSFLSYLAIPYTGFWTPAIFGGLGHSFLFPSVVAACTNQFPKEERGLSTNLILAMYDLGVFVGMPVIGKILTTAPDFGLPAYPSALLVMCATIVVVNIGFYARGRA